MMMSWFKGKIKYSQIGPIIMTKLVLWTDGFDVATLKGDIKLISMDERTGDFHIIMNKDGLKLTDATPVVFVEEKNSDNWSWLKELAIVRADIEDKSLYPTWKPNAYGEPADENAFQTIIETPTDIQIIVKANGTSDEVYNQYRPYKKRDEVNVATESMETTDGLQVVLTRLLE